MAQQCTTVVLLSKNRSIKEKPRPALGSMLPHAVQQSNDKAQSHACGRSRQEVHDTGLQAFFGR